MIIQKTGSVKRCYIAVILESIAKISAVSGLSKKNMRFLNEWITENETGCIQ